MENQADTGVRRVQASYSDEERARALAVLAANGDNVSRTAQQLGIPRKTLTFWKAADGRVPEDVAQLRAEKRAELAERLEGIAGKLLGQVELKIEGMSGKDAAIAVGILLDKAALARGEATAIAELRSPEQSEELEERAARVRERYTRRKREHGAAPEGSEDDGAAPRLLGAAP